MRHRNLKRHSPSETLALMHPLILHNAQLTILYCPIELWVYTTVKLVFKGSIEDVHYSKTCLQRFH